MVSIKEVAKRANVSIATVSRYINSPECVKPSTREKVKLAISETGYAPNTLARNFRMGRTGVVVVIIPNVADPFFDGIMKGINAVAQKEGFGIVIRESSNSYVNADEYNNLILSKQADGVILLASTNPFKHESSHEQPEIKLPVVLACESISPDLNQLPSVRIDNVLAAFEATKHLIELGHSKIAFIYGSHQTTLTQDRELGYQKAMDEADLVVDDGWTVEGGLTLEGAQTATHNLINHKNRPTAIFCANDEMAVGCIHEIKSAGLKIPDDISVVGFDNIRFAEFIDPPLTTVSQPTEEIGERSMLRLCKAIEGQDIGVEPEIVPHKLVTRRSSGPAPQ